MHACMYVCIYNVPDSGFNFPHDGKFEECNENPVNDALVKEYGREKPHPLLGL